MAAVGEEQQQQDVEVELSLGLSVGGGKRKALSGSLFSAIGFAGEGMDPTRMSKARLAGPRADGIPNPVAGLYPGPVPAVNGSGFSCMVPSCSSDSGRRSLIYGGNGGKRLKLAPSFCDSPVSGSINGPLVQGDRSP